MDQSVSGHRGWFQSGMIMYKASVHSCMLATLNNYLLTEAKT